MKNYLKYSLYTFLLALQLNTFSQNNNFIATYTISHNPIDFDSITSHTNSKDKAYNTYLKKVIANLKAGQKELSKFRYKLEFNKKAAKFYKLPVLENDSKNTKLITAMLGLFSEDYYVDKKNTLNKRDAYGKVFIVEMPILNWKITSVKRQIGKYTCYKATTTLPLENTKGKYELKISAWFAPEIPFNYGPKNYNGLPGLIIELSEGKKLTYSLLNLKKSKSKKIVGFKKGEKISFENFTSLSKKMYNNRGL